MTQGWECSLSLSRVHLLCGVNEELGKSQCRKLTRFQVAKAFFHTNLVTHPDPLPTRNSQAKFFRTHSWATKISNVDPR